MELKKLKIIPHFLIILLCVNLQKCGKEKKPFGETLLLIPEAIHDELVIDMVNSISANDQYFTSVNSGTCQFYVFDYQGELQFTYGTKGKGPSEFQWPGGIFMTVSSTLIYDEVRKSVFQYTLDGTYKDEIILKTGVTNSKFCLHNGYLFFHGMGEYPLKKIEHESGELVIGFGVFYPPFNTVKEKYFNNMDWYIQPYRKNILAVNAHHAEVNIYDTDGNLIRTLYFPELEQFFQRHKEYALSKLTYNPGERFALRHISDISVDRDKLFLLITRSPENLQKVQLNTIMVVDLKSEKISYTLTLPGEMYFGMAVRNGYCATYDYTDAQFEFYRIPGNVYR